MSRCGRKERSWERFWGWERDDLGSVPVSCSKGLQEREREAWSARERWERI